MSDKTIFIRQTGKRIAARNGQTILQAALEKSMVYPHGCRMGRCGGCKTRLVQGQVEMLEYSPFALTDAQRARNLILACRAIPISDVTVDWLGTDDIRGRPSERTVTGTVTAIADLTHDVRLVRIRLDQSEPLMFYAGQYADIRFGQAPVRSYAMANPPGASELEFYIRRVLGGFTSAYVHAVLQPGERVTLEAPRGSSYLRDAHNGPILCIADGAGLAPVRSIIESALACGLTQDMHVYFGSQEIRDLYALDIFQDLEHQHSNLNVKPVISGIPVMPYRRGVLTDVIAQEQDNLSGWKVYVAGSQTLVEAAIRLVLTRGLKIQDLHAQVFVTP